MHDMDIYHLTMLFPSTLTPPHHPIAHSPEFQLHVHLMAMLSAQRRCSSGLRSFYQRITSCWAPPATRSHNIIERGDEGATVSEESGRSYQLWPIAVSSCANHAAYAYSCQLTTLCELAATRLSWQLPR